MGSSVHPYFQARYEKKLRHIVAGRKSFVKEVIPMDEGDYLNNISAGPEPEKIVPIDY